MSEHTATPWIAAKANNGDIWIKHAKSTIIATVHPIVSSVTTPDEANAAFIVRAVNSHEALVEAIREMRRVHLSSNASISDGIAVDNLAVQALKLAEG